MQRRLARYIAQQTMLLRRQTLRAVRGGARPLSSARVEPQFLHLGPSGDFWISAEQIYAAKHNPPDYVRSLPLPVGKIIPEDGPLEAILDMYDTRALDEAQLRPAWSAGPPTAALVEPGACQLTDEFAACVLEERTWVSQDAFVARFALPDATKPLGLSTCACIMAGFGDDVRPYTPVSTNAMVGAFELLVRAYPNGALSQRLATMDIDDSVAFKHIKFNVKAQYPFPAKVGMLAGGTGITPMLQALHVRCGVRRGPRRWRGGDSVYAIAETRDRDARRPSWGRPTTRPDDWGAARRRRSASSTARRLRMRYSRGTRWRTGRPRCPGV